MLYHAYYYYVDFSEARLGDVQVIFPGYLLSSLQRLFLSILPVVKPRDPVSNVPLAVAQGSILGF